MSARRAALQPMFEWDGRSPWLLAGGAPLAASQLGVLWKLDEALPARYETMEHVPPDDPDALGWADGWEAVLVLGENGAVLMVRAEGSLAVETVRVSVSLGPDPYEIPCAECAVRGGRIIQATRLACETYDVDETTDAGRLLAVVAGYQHWWSTTVSSRDELIALARHLSGLEVLRARGAIRL